MYTAKDLQVKVIAKKTADSVVKLHHYSGKVCQNSQISFGVFIGDILIGALQYGPSIDKRRTSGTLKCKMNEYLELNRMALAPSAPKNSESRVIAITLRILRKQYPYLKCILSFADGCQCGDGTIYRASGFMLIDYKKNNALLGDENGEIHFNHGTKEKAAARFKPLKGLQFKYVYFFDDELKKQFSNISIDSIPEEFRIYKGSFRA